MATGISSPSFQTIGVSKMVTDDVRKKYKIEITEIKEEDYEGMETAVINEIHYTDEEIQKNYRYMSDDDKSKYKKKDYGNIPILKTKESKEQILQLTVDTIDLKKITNAILGEK